MCDRHPPSSKYKVKCKVNIDNFMSWKRGELRTVEIGSSRKLVRKKAYKTEHKTRSIPAPYDHVVCQLLAEDRHGDSHSSHESLRRQSYARRVLDRFVEELKQYKGPPAAFHSYVLSPILARQLNGTPDSSSIAILECVQGENHQNDEYVSIGEATHFYLSDNLTDPALIPHYQLNMVNIIEAMWHLAIEMNVILEDSPTAYNNFRTYYDNLMQEMKVWRFGDRIKGVDVAQEDEDFNLPEVEMIFACKVEGFFKKELQRIVCRIQLSARVVADYITFKPRDVKAAQRRLRKKSGTPVSTSIPSLTTAGKRSVVAKEVATPPRQDPGPSTGRPSTVESSAQPPSTPKRPHPVPSGLTPSPETPRKHKRPRIQAGSNRKSSSITEDSTPNPDSDESDYPGPKDQTIRDLSVEIPEPTGKSSVPETDPGESGDGEE